MRYKSTLFLIVLSLSFSLSAQRGGNELSIREITNGTFSPRSAGNNFRPMVEGAFYSILGADRQTILKCSYVDGSVVDTLFSVKTARECNLEKLDDYIISPNEKYILLMTDLEYIYRRSYKSNIYVYDVRRNLVEALSATPGKIRIPTFSPDGRMCAFVKDDNNIYVHKFDYNSEVQVTTDGKNNAILNGVTDWVYEEELSVTNLMQWSEDSQVLSFVKTDESEVPVYCMQVWRQGLYPHNYLYKYPKAGETNSTVSLFCYDVMNKRTSEINLPWTGEFYISRLDFAHDHLQVFTFNRNQNIFKLFKVDTRSTLVKLLFEDKSNTYVDPVWARRLVYTLNGFLYVSEDSGFARVGLYNKEGVKLKDISPEQKDVTELYGETPNGEVLYELASPTPMDRIICATNIKNNSSRLLSPKEGYSSAVFSSDLSYYLLRYSNIDTPTKYTLNKTSSAKDLVTLEDNERLIQKMNTYTFGKKEFFSVKTESGVSLNGYIVKPSNLNEQKKYPVLFVQYSGPNSQEVLNRFTFNWEYLLPEKDIIVVCLDGRGTGGRGTEYRKCTYLNLGILETNDQLEGAKAVAQKFQFIDKDRMGIWGWSFGGYMTLMALTAKEPVFKVGIAVAPPSDWGLYDSTYTERFMRQPKENPKGYKLSSALNRVNDFHGKLLIIHGTADDNVHVQNTMLFTSKLVENNKHYEQLFYKDKNHSIYGGNTRNHLYQSMLDFLLREL